MVVEVNCLKNHPIQLSCLWVSLLHPAVSGHLVDYPLGNLNLN
jgi:hypothetical protein